ncbi:peptide deformylase [Dactylosporangium sp. CA-233914]|uniref:peptide deformylase n=1 Tax=Dactylosporangium sp. CA-233914 TaxID=3239934 RepID=UPI003D8CE325
MTIQPIRVLGDPVLRSPADPVTSFDAALRSLVRDLLDTLTGEPGRAGVAAPQIGVPLRVFAYGTTSPSYLVNPRITARSGQQDGDEGCLSIPGLAFPTPRAFTVTATGFDEHGDPVTVTGSGLLARALQHELDHLDGVLYIDTLTGDARRQALRAVRATFRPGSRTAEGRA